MKKRSRLQLVGVVLSLAVMCAELYTGKRNAIAVAFSAGAELADSSHVAAQGLKAPRKRLFTTGTWGGRGGQARFEERPLIGWTLTAVTVCAGEYVDEIWSAWSGPGAPTDQRSRECEAGTKGVFELEFGESLTMVRLRAGAWVDGIELVTNRGRRRWFGNSAGGVGVSTCEFNRHYRLSKEIIGFRGRRGAYVDSIGFVVRVEGERIPEPVFTCSDFLK